MSASTTTSTPPTTAMPPTTQLSGPNGGGLGQRGARQRRWRLANAPRRRREHGLAADRSAARAQWSRWRCGGSTKRSSRTLSVLDDKDGAGRGSTTAIEMDENMCCDDSRELKSIFHVARGRTMPPRGIYPPRINHDQLLLLLDRTARALVHRAVVSSDDTGPAGSRGTRGIASGQSADSARTRGGAASRHSTIAPEAGTAATASHGGRTRVGRSPLSRHPKATQCRAHFGHGVAPEKS